MNLANSASFNSCEKTAPSKPGIKHLVLAVPRSEYDDDDLQLGWNRSVDEAMEGLPRIVQRRLAHVLAAMK